MKVASHLLLLGLVLLLTGIWMFSFLDAALVIPLKGSFQMLPPTGLVERAGSFLPYPVLWPTPAVLLGLAFLVLTAVGLTVRIYRDAAGQGARLGTVLLCTLTLFSAMGVLIGEGTAHYLRELGSVRTVSVSVHEWVRTPLPARSKGDYASRTVMTIDPPLEGHAHLWLSPEGVSEDLIESLPPGDRVELVVGRDPHGLWVLLEWPRRIGSGAHGP